MKRIYTKEGSPDFTILPPDPDTIRHQEAATPRTFARFTARAQGIVGGIGQRIPTFGPLVLPIAPRQASMASR